ncbi:MAG: YbhB/YbcL family Raf kinase inhibitor-like protein [Labilithrix sp.]|nr:YbhB/YbcL family Raf kinase inhibitor-like protein [Labilithrix sp.]
MCKLHTVAFRAVALAALVALAGCSRKDVAEASPAKPGPPSEAAPVAKLTLTSSSFPANGPIPAKHTCEGAEVSPALAWSDPPPATKSLAVVVSDPDAPDPAAPKQVFVHWVLYDIPPSTREIAEGARSAADVGGTARDGKNDFGQTGWKGPCPPKGRHRYVHEVYALDAVLPDLERPTKGDLEKAMRGHVIAKGELIGTYEKSAK